MANLQQPDKEDGEGNGKPYRPLQPELGLLSALRGLVLKRDSERENLRENVKTIQGLAEGIILGRITIDEGAACLKNLSKPLPPLKVYMELARKASSLYDTRLIEKLCRSSLAWRFIGKAFYQRDDFSTKVTKVLSGFSDQEKSNLIGSMKIHDLFKKTSIAQHLLGIMDADKLIADLAKKVEQSALELGECSPKELINKKRFHYNLMSMTCAVLEASFNSGKTDFNLKDIKSLYCGLVGKDFMSAWLVKEFTEALQIMFPEQIHVIIRDKLSKTDLSEDNESYSSVFCRYGELVETKQIATKIVCDDLIDLLREQPTMAIGYVYHIAALLTNREIFGNEGLKKIEAEIYSEITEGKNSKLLVAVCHLANYTRVDETLEPVLEIIKGLFSYQYETGNDIASAFKRLTHCGYIDDSDEEDVSAVLAFGSRAQPMRPLMALAFVGYDSLFEWAASEEIILSENVKKTLRECYDCANPKQRRKDFMSEIIRYMRPNDFTYVSSEEFEKFVEKVAGF
jgi:hypothetical protein